jgi:hypothetical protein
MSSTLGERAEQLGRDIDALAERIDQVKVPTDDELQKALGHVWYNGFKWGTIVCAFVLMAVWQLV